MHLSLRRFYRLSAFLLAAAIGLAVCAPPFVHAKSDFVANLGHRPDVPGGYSSSHLILKLRQPVYDGLPDQLRREGDPRSRLSAKFQEIAARWGVAEMRPLYGRALKYGAAARKHGLERIYVVEVPAGTDTPSLVRELEASPDVELVALDGIGGVAQTIPNDTHFGVQYAMNNTGQTGGVSDADIDAAEAWDIHTGDVGTVTIAIIDSGVTPHVDFSAHMVPGRNTDNPLTPTLTTDACPHGTHVAGIAAAIGNNGQGVAGVSWGANIMPVRVLGGCSGLASRVADGIVWATDNGADVLNISLQFYNLNASDQQIFLDAINYAHDQGKLVVAAAGNGFGGVYSVVAYPAKFTNCIAVSGTTDDDVFAQPGVTLSNWGSNYGPEIDICAPGDRIYSTLPGHTYNYFNGTSMSAPLVSGLAALMKSHTPQLNFAEIRELIFESADDLGPPGWDQNFGIGRLNAGSAMQALILDSDGDLVADVVDNCVAISNSDQADQDSDEVGDLCDNCIAIANPGQEDCQPNTVGDLCDIADLTSPDCDTNQVPDECDPDSDADGVVDGCDVCPNVANQGPEDCDAAGRPDACDSPLLSTVLPLVARNRYLSFLPGNYTCSIALKVTLVASEYSPGSVGLEKWVALPENGSSFARLVDEPVFSVWPDTSLHVSDCEIVPAAEYEIQSIVEGKDLEVAANYSAPLELATIARPGENYWADVADPIGTVDIRDIAALVDAFKEVPSALPVIFTDLAPETPDLRVDIRDVAATVDGFKGIAYPYAAPANCP